MSQDLARNLLAVGGTVDEQGEVNYLLFVDPKDSFLNCQHWKGDTLVKEELIVDSVRPNSRAAYLITPTERLVIYITPSSKLNSYTYDEDEREWVESDETPIANFAVHPTGRVVASQDATGKAYVFFQDPSQRLICLDEAYTPTTLPVNPIAGTPISTLATEDEFHVYYISATDKFIHGLVRGSGGTWKDSVASKYAFTEEVKAFCSGNEEFYVLTAANTLFKVNMEGTTKKLGTVNGGKFVPETAEEARVIEDYYPNGRLKRRYVEMSNLSYKWNYSSR